MLVVSHQLIRLICQGMASGWQEVINRTGVKSVKLINDNGRQLLSKDFREVFTVCRYTADKDKAESPPEQWEDREI